MKLKEMTLGFADEKYVPEYGDGTTAFFACTPKWGWKAFVWSVGGDYHPEGTYLVKVLRDNPDLDLCKLRVTEKLSLEDYPSPKRRIAESNDPIQIISMIYDLLRYHEGDGDAT